MYVSVDKSGRIMATTGSIGYKTDDMFEFNFPNDFDFLKQDDYRIVNSELIFDPVPDSDVKKEVERNALRQNQFQTAVLLFINANTKPLTDEQALSVSLLIDEWAKDTSYEKDQIIRYQDELYRIGQDHTSQEQWIPGQTGTEALYSRIKIDEEGHEEWKVYDGVSGIYDKGQVVIDPTDGELYISKIPNNVWGPPSQQPTYWELNEKG